MFSGEGETGINTRTTERDACTRSRNTQEGHTGMRHDRARAGDREEGHAGLDTRVTAESGEDTGGNRTRERHSPMVTNGDRIRTGGRGERQRGADTRGTTVTDTTMRDSRTRERRERRSTVVRQDLTSGNRARSGGEDDDRDRCTDVIHIDDDEDDINGTLCPQCAEESREYEVNALWGMRNSGGRRQFLINWAPPFECHIHDTWEWEENISKFLVREFLESCNPRKRLKEYHQQVSKRRRRE